MKQRTFTKFLAAAFAVIANGGVLADEPNHHHPKLAEDVDAFHAVLAPIWHARPSTERLQNACAKADEMTRLAGDIRSTDPVQLVSSVSALRGICKKKGDVDGALYDVHEAFHHLIDAKPNSAKRSEAKIDMASR